MPWLNILTIAIGAAATVAPQLLPLLSPHAAQVATAILGGFTGLFHLFQTPHVSK